MTEPKVTAGTSPDRPTDPVIGPAEVTPDLVTRVLHRAGIGLDATVTAVDGGGIGTGQVGQNVRFGLTWSVSAGEAAERGLPPTLVGKFPSDDDKSRSTAAATSTYIREVGFYRDLASEVDISIPTVWYVAEDRAGNDFTILMADLAPAVQGDQLTGCPVEHAELAVDQAATLHGSSWGRLDLVDRTDWLSVPDAESAAGRFGLYRTVFPAFVDRYRSMLPADDIAFGEAMGERLERWFEVGYGQDDPAHDWCLAHGDYRLDNMLFAPHPDSSGGGVAPGRPGAVAPVTVVDWQTVSIGSGPADVAYFVGAGLEPGLRTEVEEVLLVRYLDGLRARGVTVDADRVRRQYVLGSFTGYLMAVVASQIVGQTDRGDAMFVAMAAGHADQGRRLGLLDLVT
ncbi:MAG: phosphotransferase family protein [Acidimicrobiales bacterium]